MSEPALKPCPFCGGANLWCEPEIDIPESMVEVGCTDCGATILKGTKLDAIKAWQARSNA